jgi:DNA-binding transcriptional regulator YdaS (Cro superfamily)
VNALQRAIAICGTQTELARRVKGKPASGHVHYWLQHGFDEDTAIAIERAVAGIVAESPAAADRAREFGLVTVEQLLPDLEWHRDAAGAVISYTKRVRPAEAA